MAIPTKKPERYAGLQGIGDLLKAKRAIPATPAPASLAPTTGDEFSWANPGDSVVIDHVDSVAVYTSPGGQIVIRQENSVGLGPNDEDNVILIPRHAVNSLIAALKREAEK